MQTLKIAVDTNVLVRAVMQDDQVQASKAIKTLKSAEQIAIALPVLCEFVWVLRRTYQLPVSDIVLAIRTLITTTNIETNRPAVEAGLVMLESGGDFADGVIAFEGRWLGADMFVSFDKKAVALLDEQGYGAMLL